MNADTNLNMLLRSLRLPGFVDHQATLAIQAE